MGVDQITPNVIKSFFFNFRKLSIVRLGSHFWIVGIVNEATNYIDSNQRKIFDQHDDQRNHCELSDPVPFCLFITQA